MHQFDVLYVPSDVVYGTEYKYILTGIDVTSRYKVARALGSKKADEVAFVLEAIYKKVVISNIQKSFSVTMAPSSSQK